MYGQDQYLVQDNGKPDQENFKTPAAPEIASAFGRFSLSIA